MTSLEFWSEHQVGGPYKSARESTWALLERAVRFPSLLKLMPVNFPEKDVLDYGCGPGHDTILFALHGAYVQHYDVSPLAMEITKKRMRMHGLISLPFMQPRLFDHIHCAGVLHHAEDPVGILSTLARMLDPQGQLRLMVYDGELSDHTQSRVPITHWWDDDDVRDMAGEAGMSATYLGSYECSAEWRPNCWAACYRLRIPS